MRHPLWASYLGPRADLRALEAVRRPAAPRTCGSCSGRQGLVVLQSCHRQETYLSHVTTCLKRMVYFVALFFKESWAGTGRVSSLPHLEQLEVKGHLSACPPLPFLSCFPALNQEHPPKENTDHRATSVSMHTAETSAPGRAKRGTVDLAS